MVTNDAILDARECPYCGKAPEFLDSSIVYNKSYGMMYICQPCKAWVGVHAGSRKALGRLANGQLRFWKMKAHDSFDNLWKRKMKKGFSKTKSRHTAYKWLSDSMGIDPKYTHIGMFDIQQCREVVELCKPYQK